MDILAKTREFFGQPIPAASARPANLESVRKVRKRGGTVPILLREVSQRCDEQNGDSPRHFPDRLLLLALLSSSSPPTTAVTSHSPIVEVFGWTQTSLQDENQLFECFSAWVHVAVRITSRLRSNLLPSGKEDCFQEPSAKMTLRRLGNSPCQAITNRMQ
jgi:hypothetical protein